MMSLRLLILFGSLIFAVSNVSRAADAPTADALQQFSASIETLVEHVAPSVVQILVTGYGPVVDPQNSEADLVVGTHRSLASGVIVDGEGYIMTNAHVVTGSQRIQVVLPATGAAASPIRSLAATRGQRVEARVIGIARDLDLALLKVDMRGLSPLPFADYEALRQGELVFAFGSPEGLRNSMTMGVVSNVARQPDADHPMVYIQTDAPITHGNSGGPLVNVRGELEGINTFMLTESGGSQGLGFAIPSAIVSVAYQQLRTYGRFRRAWVGANLQTVTPEMAEGLGLPQDWGVVISDVFPEGPAERAGLHIGDIILRVDGRAIDSLPQFAFELYRTSPGERLSFDVLRGDMTLTVAVLAIERPHESGAPLPDVDPDMHRVPQLGILGFSLAEADSTLVSVRTSSGVLVTARTQDPRAADIALSVGDVIHAVNGRTVSTVSELRQILDTVGTRTAVVLQIEREGTFRFVTCDVD
jgi:serine protease Do